MFNYLFKRVGIKKGYYNTKAFLNWLRYKLLPYLNPYPLPYSTVVLDNLSIYLNAEVRKIIELKGYLIKFLPSYSPDFNLVELKFSVFKAWFRRYLYGVRPQFEGSFGGLLAYAIKVSECNRHTIAYFSYSIGIGYIFKRDWEEY